MTASADADAHDAPTETADAAVVDRRWLALLILCLGDLMIVLDVTIVGVALPSIRADLGFSEESLAWVVNAYLITFGGFLLLGGRLGDLFGHRTLFLAGVALFTAASAVCGFADSQGVLIGARAVQGAGAAVVSAVALSLMMTLFTEPAERAKAMGIFGFVASGGGSLGVLLGGILTDALNWHWIFLVNVPVGVLVVVLTLDVIPGVRVETASRRLDVAGAVTVTASLMIAVYSIVMGNEVGWLTGQTLGLLAASAVLLALFLAIEARVRSPLVPLRLFRLRNIAVSNAVGVLWAGAMFAWFCLTALYLQLVLGYTPLQVGFAFLPGNLVMGAMSIGLSAKLVLRFGIRPPLTVGLLFASAGLLLLARAPVDGALGLAVLASLAASRTDSLLTDGESQAAALTGGYHVAFLVGAIFAAVATSLGALLLRPETTEAGKELEGAVGEPAPCNPFAVADHRASEQPA
jgi:EmrB/QacA subfamily drug resistance transporter